MSNDIKPISTQHCLICKGGKKNRCLHWHINPETKDIWVYCVGVCQRAYSIYQYCHQAGLSLNEFLKNDFDFKESKPNEVNKLDFPQWYLTLSDPRAKDGVEYIKGRGLRLEGDMYYDSERRGIVFPYYFNNTFVGAQTRFLEPRVWKDGTVQKIDTTPGTRLGLLFYNWNQAPLMANVKGLILVEGALDAISIQQSLNDLYGSIADSPWRVAACSGAGATKHHLETAKDLKEKGYKIIVAPDSDEAGLLMLEKFKKADAVTHYAFTSDSDKDWNDCLKEMGHDHFSKWFISQIKKV